MPQLKRNYILTLEGEEVMMLRDILASIPIVVSANYPMELRKFHQELYEKLKER
jgi:hypothetical protein